jgi:translation elongation factor EF-1alpha
MLDTEVKIEVEVGRVTDFYAVPVVAAVLLGKPLESGNIIRIKGSKTDLEMPVTSMQINNRDVDSAVAGDSVGIKVPEQVRRGDIVYMVIERLF